MTDRPTPLACKRAEERDAASWTGAKVACPICFFFGIVAAYSVPAFALFVVAPIIESAWRSFK